MMKRVPIPSALALVCALAWSGLWARAAAAKTGSLPNRPNIIVILADDLGYGDTSVFGGWVKTPNLERMAAEGLTFTDFHSNSSVCSPTRAAFLTGRYQQRVGIVDVVARHLDTPGLDPSELTIPRLLKQVGYYTALFGKWHLGAQPRCNPVHHGFDEFRGYLSGYIDYHAHEKTWMNGLKVEDQPGYSTHIITRNAVEFIERNRTRPFFLYVAHEAVHLPFQTPEDTPDKRKPIPKSERWSRKRIRPKYKVMLEEEDKGVGAILDAVKRTGLTDRTLVFFFSDNGAIGAGSNLPFRGGKFSHYEGGHRVPAIAWWPGRIRAGAKTSELAVGMDLLPTFAELAGAAIPPDRKLDGVSLCPLLFEGKPLPRRKVFFGYEPKLGTALRDGKWKMILSKKKFELYDLSTDIGERTNLVSVFPERARAMRREIENWKREVDWSRYPVKPLTPAQAEEYNLDPAFYKKAVVAQNILIASSDRVSDFALRETAYQFDMILQNMRPDVVQRIRERGVLCLLIGHDEFPSDLPQFHSGKTGKELAFYNWRNRGFLSWKGGRPTVVLSEEDVMQYEGGMRKESILIHEFGHVIQGAGFDEELQERLTKAFQAAKAKGLYNDARAAQRFRRIRSATPVSLFEALVKWFPDESPELIRKCLDGGDILVNGKPTNAQVKVAKDDKVLIVFGGPKQCYAIKNRSEYWAEGVQDWFDANRTMDHDHNRIHTRAQLRKYDPGLARLCAEVLGNGPWRFVSPNERAGTGHLRGYDPAQAPKVEQPEFIKTAANDYYDEYWKDYWQRLYDKYGMTRPVKEERK